MYEKALKFPGNHIHTYFYLGVLNEKLQKYKKAINHFKNCLNLDNAHFYSTMHLATLLLNAGEVDRAKKYYKHALKIDPESIDAHFSLGRLIQNSHEDSLDALEYYNIVLEKDPYHYKVMCQLGILYCEKNDAKKAIQYLKD